jgi:chromosome segregation ATPase
MRVSDRIVRGFGCCCLTAWLVIPGVPSALAQQAADPAAVQQALNRAQGLLRQLAEQRSQLEADNAAAQARLARLERDLARERRRGEELATDLELAARDKAALDRRFDGTSRRLEQVEARLVEVVAKYKALAGEHRTLQGAHDELTDRQAQTEAALADARQRNRELYTINHEILDRYMDKGTWTDFLQREPLLGLKQVEAENFEQEMRLRSDDHRLDPTEDTP